MRPESHKKSNYRRPRIKDFKDKKPKSKGQTKDLKRRRSLSRFYSNNSSLRTVYV